ncbi:MAG TPA: myo-inositol-1-phosphate synthase [Thiotrichales bacterium]|nr:myo-inositol-1-phosphate synthase [Thiotrichales bacterium]
MAGSNTSGSKTGSKTGSSKTGIWIAGARGDIASTLIIGTEALKQQRISASGMTTAIPPTSQLDLVGINDLVIGGIDIVDGNLAESIKAVGQRSRTFDSELVTALKDEIDAIGQNIVCEPDALWEAGDTDQNAPNMAAFILKLRTHLRDFANRHQLRHIVVVNLTSSETLPQETPEHDTLAGIERLIAGNSQHQLTPSICYAYAALQEGCSYINFTPNRGMDLKGLQELATQKALPFYGDDGKTGETLVKTALAPMFLYRNLKVMSWEGVNMLGNGDGQTLDKPGHKVAKLRNKGNVLDSILGYTPHAGVDINFVPSLGDWKTAWDLIHFQGFLDVKMSMQFTWQGCDSILAAPLVLDMVRLSEFAARHNEPGAMKHLAAFFKNPLDCDEMDFHRQFQYLLDYVQAHLENAEPRLTELRRQK